jgi:hypothetical protein
VHLPTGSTTNIQNTSTLNEDAENVVEQQPCSDVAANVTQQDPNLPVATGSNNLENNGKKDLFSTIRKHQNQPMLKSFRL